jgi:hypothetical protein
MVANNLHPLTCRKWLQSHRPSAEYKNSLWESHKDGKSALGLKML